MSFHVVIPARRHSQRLPDKALLDIRGKPMIVRVFENASRSACSDCLVATDDEEILETVERAGGRAVMTQTSHVSGTDRIAEVCALKGWHADDIVVNVQGDEPLLPPSLIDQVADLLRAESRAEISTLCAPLIDASEHSNPNVVKVVCDNSGLALYFSRAPIPFNRDDPEQPLDIARRHIGIYAYRVSALRTLVEEAPASLELGEKLEQLRAMSIGFRIAVADAVESPGTGVDTREDLEFVRKALASI